jgi:hypothetical protein
MSRVSVAPCWDTQRYTLAMALYCRENSIRGEKRALGSARAEKPLNG